MKGCWKTITTLVIGFVAAWALEKVIGSVLTLAGSVAKLLYNLTATKVMVGILIGLIVQVAAAWDNMSTLEKAIAIMGLAAVAAATLAVTLHAIKGVVGALAVAGAIVGGIAMVTAATSGANSRASGAVCHASRCAECRILIISPISHPARKEPAAIMSSSPFWATKKQEQTLKHRFQRLSKRLPKFWQSAVERMGMRLSICTLMVRRSRALPEAAIHPKRAAEG